MTEEEKEQLIQYALFQKEFDNYISQPGIDCFISESYGKWEVRINALSPYGEWSVFKKNEQREKAMSMAYVEAKKKKIIR
jgi:hypothetical protein